MSMGRGGNETWRNFLSVCYFVVVTLACFTVVHVVGIVGFHNWQRMLGPIPVGFILGISELVVFSASGLLSIYFGVNALKRFYGFTSRNKKGAGS